MMVPILPETAPFTSGQRAWLNGFFAGVLGLGDGAATAIDQSAAVTGSNGHSHGHGNGMAAPAAPAVEEEFPWHDPNIPLTERLQLAEGNSGARVLMAAMAQLDCGACGYLCQTYSEAIARGEETDLTKCTPGGRETSKKLKELVAQRTTTPAVATSGPSATTTLTTTTSALGSFDRRNPFRSQLLACVRLNQPGSAKDVRRVAFSLQGSGLSFEVGDALGLVPENDPELVEAVLKALGARGDEVIATPGGASLHSYEALATGRVITRVSDELAALMVAHATDANERDTLRTLVEDDPEGVPANWDVLDILDQFPSSRPPVEAVIAALGTLQPRLYSISSSLKALPGEVQLTVGMVRYPQGGRLRRGVASGFLGETLRLRHKAGVFVHASPGFRLPRDGGVPVIMIGPGTGVAPFRAFLQDRAADGSRGKNWLFFGDQRRATDFLYQDELENHLAGGVLTRLDLAFSRDQAEKVYVQDRLRQNAAEVWSWLSDGAHLYVCGDARRMALDVDAALHAIVAERGGMSADAAKAFVRDLSQGRAVSARRLLSDQRAGPRVVGVTNLGRESANDDRSGRTG